MSDPFQIPPILFYVVTGIALIGWLALIFWPTRTWSNFWLAGVIVPQLLCLIYIYAFLTFWFLKPPGELRGYLSLAGVYRLFGNSGLLLVGWTNLIAMDLVAGAWMTRKAQQVGMPYVYLLPCLLMTFVFAGFGFTMFVIATSMGARWRALEAFEGPRPTASTPVAVKTPPSPTLVPAS